MWNKKWYLKRNISCNARLLNELLENNVPWDYAIVVRSTEETVGFPEWTAQFSVWKTNGKDSSEAWAITYQNFAVYSVFLSGMTSYSKIAQFNWECTGRFRSLFPNFSSPSVERPLKQFFISRGAATYENFTVQKKLIAGSAIRLQLNYCQENLFTKIYFKERKKWTILSCLSV
jgi:hypothetical protein